MWLSTTPPPSIWLPSASDLFLRIVCDLSSCPPVSTTAEPSVGELRFIARLSSSTLPNGPTAAIIRSNSGAVEGSDVFKVGDQTRSKCKSDSFRRAWDVFE